MAETRRFTRVGDAADPKSLKTAVSNVIPVSHSIKLGFGWVDVTVGSWSGLNESGVQAAVTGAASRTEARTATLIKDLSSDPKLLAFCEWLGQRQVPPMSGAEVLAEISALVR